MTISSFCCLFTLHLTSLVLVLAAPSMLKNESDLLVLLSFKDQITIDPFQVLSSWNNSLHFCQWQGVACSNRHERVTVLNLGGFKLEGTLPSHLGYLSFLKVFYFSHNKFKGAIVHGLGHLFRTLRPTFSKEKYPSTLPNAHN